ncbi:MAG: beta-ketoacyl-[acyl-carrier-protein] synthase family protein [Lentimicrobiaceae bacterium]|nr:beta-ketoacyl-[acyl-carrier-protein] synthase family protein [Lentimicrobiaceae bacterium]
MARRVFVTGIGIISSIGSNVEKTLASVFTGRSGIGKAEFLPTLLRDILPVAEIKLSNDALADQAGVSPKQYTRTALLGMLAAKQATEDAQITSAELSQRTLLLSATSVGGMDKSENFYREFIADNRKGRLSQIVHHDCGDSTEAIADYIGVKQGMGTISTACSSSANSIMLGTRLIRNGLTDKVIAGGTDALTRFTLNGFNSLMILDKNPCRPFDETRNGLNLGEAAAFIVLEPEKAITANKKFYCEVTGYDNACDAFHQTASSPEGLGALLAMKKALSVAGLQPSEIQYINVHGTGTQNNDLSEGIAIQTLFGENVPLLSSTKSFTGHTLGATGAVEAILSILSIKQGIVYPNLNFSEKMKELNFYPNTQLLTGKNIVNVLSNSFGFGGNNTTLIFSRR